MARGDRLRALYIAREHLSDAHGALLGSHPTSEMRRMAHTVALLVCKVGVQIATEEARLEQGEADAAGGMRGGQATGLPLARAEQEREG